MEDEWRFSLISEHWVRVYSWLFDLEQTGPMLTTTVFLWKEHSNWLFNPKWSALRSNIRQTEQIVCMCLGKNAHMYTHTCVQQLTKEAKN